MQDLRKEVGADEAFENFLLAEFRDGSFDALGNPLTALRFGKMHEFRTDFAGVVAASLVGDGSGEREIGMVQRLEETDGVEGGLVVAPAAEGVENALAVLFGGCGAGNGLVGV